MFLFIFLLVSLKLFYVLVINCSVVSYSFSRISFMLEIISAHCILPSSYLVFGHSFKNKGNSITCFGIDYWLLMLESWVVMAR